MQPRQRITTAAAWFAAAAAAVGGVDIGVGCCQQLQQLRVEAFPASSKHKKAVPKDG
jgi:hypothetical protein